VLARREIDAALPPTTKTRRAPRRTPD